MHDGYIFTLGVCGTASASSVAPALLGMMMTVLPPVKRAAYLGDVLRLNGSKDLPHPTRDTLLDEVLADMHDAELLLLVSPIHIQASTGVITLPARMQHLLERARQLPPAALHGKWAILVSLARPDMAHLIQQLDPAQHPLHTFCAATHLHVVASHHVATDTGDRDTARILQTLLATKARDAYALIRTHYPDALPPADDFR